MERASREPGRPRFGGAVAAHLLPLLLLSACGRDASVAGSGGGGDREPDGGDGAAARLDDGTPLGAAVAALRRTEDGEAWRAHLEEVLSGWGGARQPMTDLIRETYRQRGHRPVFLDGLWPSPAAAMMVKAVREVPSHGLPASPYRPKVLVPLHDALAADPATAAGTLTAPIGELDRLARLEWEMPRSVHKAPRKNERVPEVAYRPLDRLPSRDPVEPAVRCVLDRLREASPRRELEERLATGCRLEGPALDAALNEALARVEADREHMGALALLDALLVQAFYQWVIDFTIDSRFHPFLSHGPVNRSRLPTQNRAELLAAIGDLGDGEAFGERLRGVVPRLPEYDHARRALDRYVRLMDSKRVEPLSVRGWVEKGASGDVVAALQRRLAAEDLYDGPVTGVLDEATHEAVVAYQRARGLAAGGVVGAETVESLNVPLEWRVKQLVVALGRIRESPLVRSATPDRYVRVNLPAQELELVEDGRVGRRHRVIVGSNRRVEDPMNEGVVWRARRTPIFDTKVVEVVLNPTWIVPEAIRREEIEPKVGQNPRYFEENNFQTVGALLVQGPAPTNPLGVVKLTLESTDAVYLHDTDKRWLFKEARRDLSHGCVRVDEPVELAKHLLARQGVDGARVDARVADGRTLPIKLVDPLPIFVEYSTVGFAEDGAPAFYQDVYEYDTYYWKKRTPITRRFP